MRRVGAVGGGLARPAFQGGVGAGGGGEGADGRPVHRLVARGHDLPRRVLAHGRPLHLLTVAAPEMCQALAVTVALCLEVGVSHNDVSCGERSDLRVVGGRIGGAGAKDDHGVAPRWPNLAAGAQIREVVVLLGTLGLAPLGDGLVGELFGGANDVPEGLGWRRQTHVAAGGRNRRSCALWIKRQACREANEVMKIGSEQRKWFC